MPLLGQFMTLSGAVFIDRKNNARAFESLAEAGDTIKKRETSLWVFPEGTRTSKQETDLKPFKKGAFHLAVQAGVPITPVVCQNYWHLYHKGVFESGTLKIKGKFSPHVLPPDPIPYVLLCRVPTVLPPIPTIGLTKDDVTQLAVTVREQMLAALHEISGTQPVETKSPPSAPESTPDSVSNPPTADPTSESPERIEIRELKKEGTDIVPLSIDTESVVAAAAHKHEGSDKGPETEEDEGMVLVDRPPSAT